MGIVTEGLPRWWTSDYRDVQINETHADGSTTTSCWVLKPGEDPRDALLREADSFHLTPHPAPNEQLNHDMIHMYRT